MNERIRELYEQARLHAKTIDADLDPQGWMNEYHKKFAQLILDEATDIVYDLLDDNTGAEVVVRVKEHFGVE